MQITSRLKQHDEYKKKLEDEWHEMAKPLARYKDDKDLDEMLKQQEREEDPMLSFIKKTKAKSKEKKKGMFYNAQDFSFYRDSLFSML